MVSYNHQLSNADETLAVIAFTVTPCCPARFRTGQGECLRRRQRFWRQLIYQQHYTKLLDSSLGIDYSGWQMP